MTELIVYPAAGALAGLLAGLMGIGGGLVIVPMLAYFFAAKAFPPSHIMHLALGTSLASIIFTSISSFLAHHRRGAVRWDVVYRFVPGLVGGTLLGAYLASRVSTSFLQGLFGVFLLYAAAGFLLDKKPQPSRRLPGRAGMYGAGGVIGVMSSLLGIGGGTLSVPYLVWCNITMHHAVGTAAALGLPIAVSGALGYILSGWQKTGLPSFTFGYVYLPAVLGLVIASVLTAPLGAKFAHWLPVKGLKRIFSVLLLIVGLKMLLEL